MEVKPTYVLSALLAVSLLLLGGVSWKVVQMEDELHSLKTDSQEEQFSLPTGTPAVYGEELAVAYEDVSQQTPETAEETIQKFARYDRIELSGEEKQRYIDILYEMSGGISCEYCCEARAIITREGDSGCGCAHAVAMRGLAKYLLQNHGDEMADAEIFQEVAKWKTRYFPQQTRSKAAGLNEQEAEVTYVNLAANEYRGVSASGGDWVGDC